MTGCGAQGSYRRVMRAASICVLKDLPFTLNMVLTAQNRHEVAEMVGLAARLGSRGVRFGHLMPTPETAIRGLICPAGAAGGGGRNLARATEGRFPSAWGPAISVPPLFPLWPSGAGGV